MAMNVQILYNLVVNIQSTPMPGDEEMVRFLQVTEQNKENLFCHPDNESGCRE